MTEIETNYDAGEFVGGTFIKKEDLAAGPQRFTIEGVSTATFEARNGRPESTVLQLDVGDGRKFSLGTKINVKILIAAFGRKTADWIGKEIVLFIDPNVGVRRQSGRRRSRADPRQQSRSATGHRRGHAHTGGDEHGGSVGGQGPGLGVS